jgi:hypothetical protein
MNKWMPTGLGADPKKLAILGALAVVVVAAYKFSSASASSESGGTPSVAGGRVSSSAILSPANAGPNAPAPPRRASTRGAGSSTIADFHPTLKLDEGADVSKIDPTLRLDLLAKVQQVPMEGGSRNLFEFSQPPPPPAPKVTIKPTPAGPQPSPLAPPSAAKNDPPPPPPIPLKFYGYAGTTRDGVRRAFFLDGDDIYTPAENEVVKGRYKIIRIGVNSAVVEDTTNHNQQTLPLVEELGA